MSAFKAIIHNWLKLVTSKTKHCTNMHTQISFLVNIQDLLCKCGRKDNELNMSVKIIPSSWYNTKLQLLIEIRIQELSSPLFFGPKHRLDNSDLFKILPTLGKMGKKKMQNTINIASNRCFSHISIFLFTYLFLSWISWSRGLLYICISKCTHLYWNIFHSLRTSFFIT